MNMRSLLVKIGLSTAPEDPMHHPIEKLRDHVHNSLSISITCEERRGLAEKEILCPLLAPVNTWWERLVYSLDIPETVWVTVGIENVISYISYLHCKLNKPLTSSMLTLTTEQHLDNKRWWRTIIFVKFCRHGHCSQPKKIWSLKWLRSRSNCSKYRRGKVFLFLSADSALTYL